MTGFLAGAVLMTLAAVLVVVVPLFRSRGARAPVAALSTALAIPGAVVVLYALTSNYLWGGPPAAATPADPPAITELKRRTTATPADVEAWVGLGDAYVAEARYAEAREAYRQAIAASNGGDDALRLAFAEAAILDDRNALLGDPGRLIDDVLTRDPFNPKALWYGGMAALARGDTGLAGRRWRQLLALSPPPRVREILEQQLASLGQEGGGEAGGASPGRTSPAGGVPAPEAPGAVRIPVRISIDPAVAARVKPGSVLFLFAREAGRAGGPPLAVVRREAPALPLDLVISDADGMVPGRTLAGHDVVQLTARIAGAGDAMATSGDLFGEARWNAAAGGGQPVQITIDQVVP